MSYHCAHVGRTRSARSPYLEPLEGRALLSGAGDVGSPAAEVETSLSASPIEPGPATEGPAHPAAESLVSATETTVAPAPASLPEDVRGGAGADHVNTGETNGAPATIEENSPTLPAAPSSPTAAIAMPPASVPTAGESSRSTSDGATGAVWSVPSNEDGDAETLPSVSPGQAQATLLPEDEPFAGSQLTAPAPLGAARPVVASDPAVRGDEGALILDEVKMAVPAVRATITLAVQVPGNAPRASAPFGAGDVADQTQSVDSIGQGGDDGAPAQPTLPDGESDAGAGFLARAADVLASCAPFDRGSLERAIDEFLSRFGDLDPGLPGSDLVTGLVPGVIALTAGMSAAEAVRRRLRRPWDCEDGRSGDNGGDFFPGLPGRRQRWALEEL